MLVSSLRRKASISYASSCMYLLQKKKSSCMYSLFGGSFKIKYYSDIRQISDAQVKLG